MTPTDDLREELRELLDEVIPEGGTESNTRFTNTQIDRILIRAGNINAAAADGWTRKAAMYHRELGNIQSYSAGQERYDMVKLKDAMEYALKMAEIYKNKSGMGSLIIGVTPPDIL